MTERVDGAAAVSPQPLSPQPLSAAARSVWGKSDALQHDWLPLHLHMTDTAEIAARVWDGWLPRSVREFLAQCFGGDADAARTAYVWLACAHDLGKATPEFARQVNALTARMRAQGLQFDPRVAGETRLRHSAAGQLLLMHWLAAEHGWSKRQARTFAVVLGSHHGVPPTAGDLEVGAMRPWLIGSTPEWKRVHAELARYAAHYAGALPSLPGWAATPLPKTAQLLLTGAVILADWIASSDLFPLDVRPAPSAMRATAAWRTLALPAAWHASPSTEALDDRLRARFALPPGTHARPVQRAAIELVDRIDGAGLLIVEAPMGEGKTELALLAAEQFAARTGAGGMFFALPTMATSNGVFPRVHQWVRTLPGDGAGQVPQTAFLAHGKAQLNEEFRGLERLGRIDLVGDREPMQRAHDDSMVAHLWLTGRKKGVLANFVVGTIDQVLFGALKTKHVMLRHLALAGKVVVIDEVHSSDAYMKVYLHRALQWLGAYGVPTILMSATLAPSDRHAFVAAYARDTAQDLDAVEQERAYPLLTAVRRDGAVEFARPQHSSRRVRVAVEQLADDDARVVALLRDALAEGGSAAVIRNTVDRAQHAAALIRDALPDADVRLLHSRFIASDRVAREAALVAELGPAAHRGESTRFGERPLIVVGTQVLEQSLDFDFDLMVSDLSPVDLLLQRAGRLHRHERQNRAPRVREPRLVITGADWTAEPAVPDSGSVWIYGMKSLLAAQAVLTPHLAGEPLAFPQDIARLVAAADAGEFTLPQGSSEVWAAAELDERKARAERQSEAKRFLLDSPDGGDPSIIGLLVAPVGDDDVRATASVRDSDTALEVLVVQRRADGLHLLPGHTGLEAQVIPEDAEPDRRLALAIAGSSIRLPRLLSGGWAIDSTIHALEHNWFAGWQQSPILRGELVLVLDEGLAATVAGVPVRYDRELGLRLLPTR